MKVGIMGPVESLSGQNHAKFQHGESPGVRSDSGSKSGNGFPDICSMSMTEYKLRRDAMRMRVLDKYEIIGFISSGTYGRVYKARSRNK